MGSFYQISFHFNHGRKITGWECPYPNHSIRIICRLNPSVIHVGRLSNLRLLFHLLHLSKTLSKACSIVIVQMYHDVLLQSQKRQCGQELNQKSAFQSEQLNTSGPPSAVPVCITMQGHVSVSVSKDKSDLKTYQAK